MPHGAHDRTALRCVRLGLFETQSQVRVVVPEYPRDGIWAGGRLPRDRAEDVRNLSGRRRGVRRFDDVGDAHLKLRYTALAPTRLVSHVLQGVIHGALAPSSQGPVAHAQADDANTISISIECLLPLPGKVARPPPLRVPMRVHKYRAASTAHSSPHASSQFFRGRALDHVAQSAT